jgi:hypothetical protein
VDFASPRQLLPRQIYAGTLLPDACLPI